MLFSNKKGRFIDIHNSMDESHRHYAKRKTRLKHLYTLCIRLYDIQEKAELCGWRNIKADGLGEEGELDYTGTAWGTLGGIQLFSF